MTPLSRARQRLRRTGVHCLRVCLVVAIVALIHLQHGRSVANRRSRPVAPIGLDQVRSFYPGATTIDAEPAEHGGLDVRDASGRSLGHVLRTAPASDTIIGFSGSTNVLIAFGTDDRIIGLAILSSEDTRDHVEAVREDPTFLHAFSGLKQDEAVRRTDVDAVSGATLTSRAIQEAVIRRLGGKRVSLRFPEDLTVDDVRQLFPAAASLTRDDVVAARWHVVGADGRELGTALRTSPFADDVIGYQGPTETLVVLDRGGRVAGIAVRRSYDNEPYVGYLREDAHFSTLFDGLLLDELASLDPEEAGIEGVSGATMTSQAVVEGLIRTAAEHREAGEGHAALSGVTLSIHDAGAALTVVAGMVVGLTRLRANRMARTALRLVLIAYLGLTAGTLVSLASMVGWSENGVPWRSAPGFVLLTAAALLVPITSRRNLYCSHLCPHGAAQQLLRRRLPRRWRVRPARRVARILALLPALLLVWCVVVAMSSIPFSLVDIEPFDAWVFRVAGPATLTVAIVGLLASLLVPMAYCRFGCPTGAVLGYLRLDARSGIWTRRDWLALALVAVAAGLYIV